jgi:hypothetical protein
MHTTRWVLTLTLLGAALVHAQDACESKCNQASAECLRVCVAQPSKEKKEQSAKMMQCLNTCEAQAKPCRDLCHPSKK